MASLRPASGRYRSPQRLLTRRTTALVYRSLVYGGRVAQPGNRRARGHGLGLVRQQRLEHTADGARPLRIRRIRRAQRCASPYRHGAADAGTHHEQRSAPGGRRAWLVAQAFSAAPPRRQPTGADECPFSSRQARSPARPDPGSNRDARAGTRPRMRTARSGLSSQRPRRTRSARSSEHRGNTRPASTLGRYERCRMGTR